mmetsp:Transcript_24780/g.57569  ORF Transcript_24780/g.57569 Transcript_24780/m.57569 type:complete len:93 (-) Transcript_24780:396-674(-)
MGGDIDNEELSGGRTTTETPTESFLRAEALNDRTEATGSSVPPAPPLPASGAAAATAAMGKDCNNVAEAVSHEFLRNVAVGAAVGSSMESFL